MADPVWRPPTVQLDPARPLYEQFADMVRLAIASGSLEPAKRLPSVRELAGQFRVNPNTVMRAYQDLEREGFIATFRGQGTFVSSNPDVIRHSKQALAKRALADFERVAQTMGLTVNELLALARERDSGTD